jgi:hypothetical protein
MPLADHRYDMTGAPVRCRSPQAFAYTAGIGSGVQRSRLGRSLLHFPGVDAGLVGSTFS